MRKRYVLYLLLVLAVVGAFSLQAVLPQSSEPVTQEEKTNVKWAMWVSGRVTDGEAVSDRLSESMPDLALEFQLFDRAIWQSSVNALVSSGDIPDVIFRDSQALVASYARQEVICEVPMELVQKYAPGIYTAAEDYGSEVWRATFLNGKNYGLPLMQLNNIAPFSDQWRVDMLERLGVKKIPETLEEAEAAFALAIQQDLNGNGKNDTYGLSFRGKDLTEHLFASIFGAFGVFPGKWMKTEEDRLVLGIMKDEAKDGFALLADWYQKGYIDPGFVTTDVTTFAQKVGNGTMLMNCWATVESILPPNGNFLALAQEKNPKAELVSAPPLKGPKGESGYYTWGKATASFVFGRQLAENPEKLARCLELVEFLYADTPETAYVLYGEQGVDWVQDKETNAYQSLDPDASEGTQHIASYLSGVPVRQQRFLHPLYKEYARYTTAGTIQPERDYIEWAGVYADPGIYAIKAEADRNFQRDMINIVVGKLPVESYEAIRARWYQEGGERVTEEINRAYQQGKQERLVLPLR